MSNLKLIYFGNPSGLLNSNLLHHLGLIHFSNNTEVRSGLYLVDYKDNKENFRKAIFDYENPLNDGEIYIVYKYLMNEQLEKLCSIQEVDKVFIIAHKMLNLSFINDQYKRKFSLVYVSDKSFYPKDEFYQKYLLTPSTVNSKNQNLSTSVFPYFALEFLVILLNPFEEFRAMLFKSNNKLFNRIADLISFIMFFLNTILIKKVIHFLYYRVFHFLHYKIIYFLYYRVLHFLYYKVIYFLYYRISHFLHYKVIYFLYYKFYRIFLYQIYKIATYPLFKIYWFLNYQYITRFKKYVKKNK